MTLMNTRKCWNEAGTVSVSGVTIMQGTVGKKNEFQLNVASLVQEKLCSGAFKFITCKFKLLR